MIDSNQDVLLWFKNSFKMEVALMFEILPGHQLDVLLWCSSNVAICLYHVYVQITNATRSEMIQPTSCLTWMSGILTKSYFQDILVNTRHMHYIYRITVNAQSGIVAVLFLLNHKSFYFRTIFTTDQSHCDVTALQLQEKKTKLQNCSSLQFCITYYAVGKTRNFFNKMTGHFNHIELLI